MFYKYYYYNSLFLDIQVPCKKPKKLGTIGKQMRKETNALLWKRRTAYAEWT